MKFNLVNLGNKRPQMEKIVVWTCQSEFESAKKLGYPTYVHLPHTLEYYNENGITVIRWGVGYESYYQSDASRGEFLNTFNTSKAISNNVQKNEALKKLSKVVLTPKIYNKVAPKDKYVVYRPTTHATGSGFQVVKGGFPIEFGKYCTEYIQSKDELRVWYINGKYMAAKRVTYSKVRSNEKFPCRSKWSYRFIKKVPKNLENQCAKAAKTLDMVFGAFDIISKNNKYYFLENNCAASLDSPEIIKFYKDGFESLIKKLKIRKEKRKVQELPKPTFKFDAKTKVTNVSYKIPTPNPKKSWISDIIGKYIFMETMS